MRFFLFAAVFLASIGPADTLPVDSLFPSYDHNAYGQAPIDSQVLPEATTTSSYESVPTPTKRKCHKKTPSYGQDEVLPQVTLAPAYGNQPQPTESYYTPDPSSTSEDVQYITESASTQVSAETVEAPWEQDPSSFYGYGNQESSSSNDDTESSATDVDAQTTSGSDYYVTVSGTAPAEPTSTSTDVSLDLEATF